MLSRWIRLSLLLPAFSFPLNYFVKPLSVLLCTAHLLPFVKPNHERLMHKAQIFSPTSAPVQSRLIRIRVCVRFFVYAVREKSASSGIPKLLLEVRMPEHTPRVVIGGGGADACR